MVEERSWNVDQIVAGATAKEVKHSLDELADDMEKIVNEFTSQRESLEADGLLEILEKVEEILVRQRDVRTYCSISYMADTTDKKAADLNNYAQISGSKIDAADTVFEIRLGELLLEKSSLLKDENLKNYWHYLEKVKAYAPYRLSESEERMIRSKDVNGVQTLQELQQAWVSSKTFTVEIGGEKKTLTLPQLSSLRMDANREIRAMASKTLYKSYADDKILHGFALRGISADHVEMAKKRGMPSTMTQSLLDQDISRETVDALLTAIESTAGRFQDFLKLKAKTMDQKKLLGYDVIAPWVREPTWNFDWPEARNLVIDAFSSFDTGMGNTVKSVFKDQRIDSDNRLGKANTAFCAGWPSAKKCFVFINFSKTLNDIYTLAHENGHAAQGSLIFNNQTPINYSQSMCLAETGSIFGELLLTEKILNTADSGAERFEILSHVLNGFMYTVYYVGVRAFFEKSVYDQIEQGNTIDSDLACELWNKAKDRIFGDAVDWTEFMEYEWARIPHHFFANYRFYNYPYSFAQMLVFAVYADYQKGSSDFNSRFKRLLAAGGSKSPREQIADFGYDLTDSSFWELGPSQADSLLGELRKVV